MVALKAGEVDAFVARPDATRPVVLILGPDAGLVRERAESAAGSGLAWPFWLTLRKQPLAVVHAGSPYCAR